MGAVGEGMGEYCGTSRPVTRSAIFTGWPVLKHWLAATPMRIELAPACSLEARRYLSAGAEGRKISSSITLSPPPWPPTPVHGSYFFGSPRNGITRVVTPPSAIAPCEDSDVPAFT